MFRNFSHELKALSVSDIDSYYQSNQHYGGSFTKDFLPHSFLPNKFYIVNLGNLSTGGTHWVLVSSLCKKFVDYADPIGITNAPIQIEYFMSKLKRPIRRNKYQIQSTQSEVCGYVCIFYADMMMYSDCYSPDQISKKFFFTIPSPENFRRNTFILKEYFQK